MTKRPLLGVIGLVGLLILPLVVIATMSVGTQTQSADIRFWPLSFEHYRRAMEPIYLGVLWQTLRIAFVATALCFLIAYPLAYFIASQPKKRQGYWFFFVVLPFLTNFLVRTYAWFVLFRPDGLVANFFAWFGADVSLLNTQTGVIVGLVYCYLPFMILPIYTALERLDFSLVEAAYDLGATHWQAFRRVIFPLSLPGVVAGWLLVMVPIMGEFVTPKLIGGGKIPMIGMIIENQFLGRIEPNWPFGAALSMLLVILATVGIVRHLRRDEDLPWVG